MIWTAFEERLSDDLTASRAWRKLRSLIPMLGIGGSAVEAAPRLARSGTYLFVLPGWLISRALKSEVHIVVQLW